MTCWHDDDDFWALVEPALFSPQRLAMATTDVDGIVKLLDLPAGAHVLDLCSGPGRHAVELAARGFRVTCVDRYPRYLERARQQAEQRGVELELVHEDMRRFIRPGAFDAVINIYTSFGYFEDENENVQVAANVRESLKAGGAALFELLGKETLALKFQQRNWSEEQGVYLLQHAEVVDDWRWVKTRWVLIRDGAVREFEVKLRLYAATELKDLLVAAGFGAVQTFGSLDGAAYDHEAKRMVVVARR